MSSAHGDPSVATTRRDALDPLATRTEQPARSTTSADTEPSSIDAIGPWPREPSTMRSAAMSAAASTIAPDARPRTTCRSTDQSRPLKGAANRTSAASASLRTASAASASRAPPAARGSPNHETGTSYAVSIVTEDPPGIDSEATRSRAWSDDGEPSIARRIRIVALHGSNPFDDFPIGANGDRAVRHLPRRPTARQRAWPSRRRRLAVLAGASMDPAPRDQFTPSGILPTIELRGCSAEVTYGPRSPGRRRPRQAMADAEANAAAAQIAAPTSRAGAPGSPRAAV